METENTVGAWLAENEEQVAELIPDLLCDDPAQVAKGAAAVLGLVVGGPVGAAVTGGLTKRLWDWGRANSATRRLLLADRAEEQNAERARALRETLQWLRDAISNEINGTVRSESEQTRLLVLRGQAADRFEHSVTQAGIEEILRRIPKVEGSSVGDALSARLDVTRDLLQAQDPNAASRALREMEAAGLLESASPAARCRWFCQCGLAFFALGQPAQAALHLEKALAIDPQSLYAVSHLADTRRVLGSASEAAVLSRRATQYHPAEALAWAIRVECDPDFSWSDIPSPLESSFLVRQAVALRCLVEKRWQQAEEKLRALADEDATGQVRYLLCLALWELGDLNQHSPTIQQEYLKEIVLEVRKGLDQIPKSNEVLRRDYLTLLGISLRRLGRYREAIRPLAAAADLSSGRVDLAFELALAYLYNESITDAESILDSLSPDDAGSALSLAMRAQIAVIRKDARAARETAAKACAMLVEESDEGGVSETLLLLSSVASSLREQELARALANHIFEETANVNARVILARMQSVLGDHVKTVRHYRAALETSGEPGIAVEYAAYLRHMGRHDEVVAVLEPSRGRLAESALQLYAESACVVGDFASSHRVVEELWEQGRRPLWLLRVRSHIASARGDLRAAIETLRCWVEVSPSEVEPAAYLALHLIRASAYEDADAILRQLRTEYGLSAEDKLRVAELHTQRGLIDEAKQLCWEGLREAPHSSDIQQAYLSLYEACSESQEGAPIRVAPGVAVEWEDEQNVRHIHLIVDASERAKSEFGEQSAASAFGASVLGLAPGDRFVFERGTPYERSGTVTLVMPKYAYGFRWATDRLAQNPASVAIRMMPMKGSDDEQLASIEKVVREGERRIEELLDIYSSNAMPLGLLADAADKPIADVYGRIADDCSRQLFVEYGDAARRTQAVGACDASEVVLTRTALLTMALLELFPLVEQLPGRLVAPQALLDELGRERTRLLKVAKWGRDTLGYANGRMVFQRTTPEEGKRMLERHDAVIQWVHDHVQILPLPLVSPLSGSETWEKTGAESHAVLQLAAANKAVVYADDLALRILARAIQISGFSTYSFLEWCRLNGVLTPQQMKEKLLDLVQLNHSDVPVDDEMLALAFQRSDYKARRGTLQVLKRLNGSRSEMLSACRVASLAVRGLLLRESVVGRHTELIDAVLEALYSQRDAEQVTACLSREVKRTFRLLPLHLDAAMSRIERFRRARDGVQLIKIF